MSRKHRKNFRESHIQQCQRVSGAFSILGSKIAGKIQKAGVNNAESRKQEDFGWRTSH